MSALTFLTTDAILGAKKEAAMCFIRKIIAVKDASLTSSIIIENVFSILIHGPVLFLTDVLKLARLINTL